MCGVGCVCGVGGEILRLVCVCDAECVWIAPMSSVRFTEPHESELYRADRAGRGVKASEEVKRWGFVELIEQLLLNHDASEGPSGYTSIVSSGANSLPDGEDGEENNLERQHTSFGWDELDKEQEEKYRKWVHENQRDWIESQYNFVQRCADELHHNFRREVEDEARNVEKGISRGLMRIQKLWKDDLASYFQHYLNDA